MKIVLYSLLLSLVLASAMPIAILASAASTYTGPRMEQIGSQRVLNNGGEGADMFVRYLHDHDTKQEIVCISAFVHADGVMSCYPTGRTW